jgi:hypothetical protein
LPDFCCLLPGDIGSEKRGEKEKRKLIVGSVVSFSKDLFKKLSGRYLGHWTVEYEDEFSVSINFLRQKYVGRHILTRAIMTDFSVTVFTG